MLDTLQLGAQTVGRNGFEWDVPAGASSDGLTFRVTATSGATRLDATPLTADRVNAVSMDGSTLTLELARVGPTAYAKIKAIS